MADFTLVTDVLPGCVVRAKADGAVLLVASGGGPCPVPRALMTGEIVLRYGLAMLYELDFLLVGWAHDDFRREYAGVEALTFMLQRGDMFPRADVRGVRVSSGTREEMFLKQLDLARGLFAFAAPAAASAPPARLSAAVWVGAGAEDVTPLGEGDSRVPALLAQAVPCLSAPPAALRDLPALLAQASG